MLELQEEVDRLQRSLDLLAPRVEAVRERDRLQQELVVKQVEYAGLRLKEAQENSKRTKEKHKAALEKLEVRELRHCPSNDGFAYLWCHCRKRRRGKSH